MPGSQREGRSRRRSITSESSSPGVRPAAPRLAYLIWGTGLAAYIIAVAGRTSLGVGGLQAVERFSISASTLATFSVVQLAVYTAAQIPVGVVLDRVGPRKLIAVGALILSAGQLMLGLADTLPVALWARVFIGLGDAAVLVSVLRLIPVWFRPRIVPMITQLTGILGQLGQIISAVPFMAILLGFGWTQAFASLAGAGFVIAGLAAVVVRDRPPSVGTSTRTAPDTGGSPPADSSGPDRTPAEEPVRPATAEPQSTDPAGGGLRAVLREPGAWLGFFTHFVTLFPTNTFLLLWGVPFLTAGQGISPQAAGALLTFGTIAGIVIGPTMGELVARYPHRRSWIVLGTVAASTVVWAMVLLPSSPRPLWQLVLLLIVVAAGVAACTIGFDFARTYVPHAHLGTAIGVVNIGGYLASLLAILIVGLVLDIIRPSGDYVLADFRLALAAQTPLLVVGLTGLLVSRHLTRRRAG